MNPRAETITKVLKEAVRQLMMDDIPEKILEDMLCGHVPTSTQAVDFGRGEIAKIRLMYKFKHVTVSSPPPKHAIRERAIIVSCSTGILACLVVKPSKCCVAEWRCEGSWVSVGLKLTPRAASDQDWMRELINSLLLEPKTAMYGNSQHAQHICFVWKFTCWHSLEIPCDWYTAQDCTYTFVHGTKPTLLGSDTYVPGNNITHVDTGNVTLDQWVQGKLKNGFTFFYNYEGMAPLKPSRPQPKKNPKTSKRKMSMSLLYMYA